MVYYFSFATLVSTFGSTTSNFYSAHIFCQQVITYNFANSSFPHCVSLHATQPKHKPKCEDSVHNLNN